MALRSSGDNALARALAPARPLRVRPDLGLGVSIISPVAILPTMTAAPITSAGRFSPRGPRGMYVPLRGNALIVACSRPVASGGGFNAPLLRGHTAPEEGKALWGH